MFFGSYFELITQKVYWLLKKLDQLSMSQLEHRVFYQLLQKKSVAEEVTKSTEQVRMILISQSFKGISRNLLKLLRYGTAILSSFVLPLLLVLPVIGLKLNDPQAVKKD